jgi:hypothetical protein
VAGPLRHLDGRPEGPQPICCSGEIAFLDETFGTKKTYALLTYSRCTQEVEGGISKDFTKFCLKNEIKHKNR